MIMKKSRAPQTATLMRKYFKFYSDRSIDKNQSKNEQTSQNPDMPNAHTNMSTPKKYKKIRTNCYHTTLMVSQRIYLGTTQVFPIDLALACFFSFIFFPFLFRLCLPTNKNEPSSYIIPLVYSFCLSIVLQLQITYSTSSTNVQLGERKLRHPACTSKIKCKKIIIQP